MAMHTNPRAALASSHRLTAEDLRLDQESRIVWLAVTGEKFGPVMRRIAQTPLKWIVYRLRREGQRSCPLELIGRVIVGLAAVEVSEAQLRLLPLYLTRLIDECFTGAAHRSLDELDRDEQRVEARENELTLERRVCGLGDYTPEQLQDEALANEQEAAVQLERARYLRRLARQKGAGILPFPVRPLPS